MTPERFHQLSANYPRLRIAVVGDFCLDRYLEIDPTRRETSIETGLPVHNVVNVRAQPGAAGTILNNLVALDVGAIYPVGFCGEDGEGYELKRALATKPGVRMDHFLTTPLRRTFTYCKPLVCVTGRAPVELNRLDSKNWQPTPAVVQGHLIESCARAAADADAVILMDQVDLPETGVVTARMLEAVGEMARIDPELPIVADSRRGLRDWPPVCLKMNAAELAALTGAHKELDVTAVKQAAVELARHKARRVFITLAERGLVGAYPDGEVQHVPALPVRGPIDVVGAGDSVTANLAAALAAGATVREALEIAAVASSIVIHQLGTTGTANVGQIGKLLPELK
jgi:rfaE bifunctional protein kinase chain/domain